VVAEVTVIEATLQDRRTRAKNHTVTVADLHCIDSVLADGLCNR